MKKIFKFFITLFPIKELENPIFIIGCGRSGTTILGNSLSRHKSIVYLNERRDIWTYAYPVTDVWSNKSKKREGKIILNRKDCTSKRKKILRKLFQFEKIRSQKPILIEKLPINNFRLEFLKSNFPRAKYIYIQRNGLEVARSIAKQANKGNWFGHDDHKWDLLKKIAENDDQTKSIVGLCDNNYKRGLLEWRLSTEAVIRFLNNSKETDYIKISYNELMEKPVETINGLAQFIKIPFDSNVNDFVKTNISRRTKKIEVSEMSDEEMKIIGSYLVKSIN